MANERIEIFHDNRHEFYIKKSSGERELLPDFIDFRRHHRKALAAAYPWMEDHIMNSEIADREIDKLICEFNEDVKSAIVTRWYKVAGNKLKALECAPKDIFLVAEYDGEQVVEEILSFIDCKKKELFHSSYAVFKCPKCQEKQYRNIVKNHVQCSKGCGSFDINDENVEVIQRFDSTDSEQNKSNAIACLFKWKKEPVLEQEIDIKTSSPFYFQGNVYRISFTDFKNLHQALYRAFACDEIFELTERGVAFTQNYKNYIRSLKDYNVNPTLFRELKVIENRINSQEYSLLPIDRAFYWYINKYCLDGTTDLYWNISNKIVFFKNKRQFVEALLMADDKSRVQLINLYRSVAALELDKTFFNGYDATLIDLSYMIYSETGLFVYVSENKLINFGDSFIENMHEFDDLISERNAFVESIKSDCLSFWDAIKGSFDDCTDFYYDSFDGTYYDRLCFYQYAILGKKEIKYKNLILSDSVQGFNKITEIIRDAYLSKDDRALSLYADMVELLKNTVLWDNTDRLIKIKEAKMTQISNNLSKEILTFDILREFILNDNCNEPSITLYLKCADTSSKSIIGLRFWYKNKLATLLDHIKRLVEYGDSKTLSNEVHQFFNNHDVNCIVNSIFNNTKVGGIERFKEEQEKAFMVLLHETERLEKELESQRKKIALEESKGTRRSDVSPTRSSRVEKVTTTKKQVKVEKKENDDDEWS